MTLHTVENTVGPFRSELAAKMYRETFMIAQNQHSVSLGASIREDNGGWFVATHRTPKDPQDRFEDRMNENPAVTRAGND